ncbi:spermine oxidase-like [Drosophila albomicans]|uniref:Spermine oxidase-like n=1 Tax=Drosophila albomicans TaxID=7291 RepID=A0A6P8X417_DROAB|nr:spermine oxidase-like [Drosophila albomicans]
MCSKANSCSTTCKTMTTCAISPPVLKSKETARIVIIGSGPSGIAAATRLIEQGFKNVRILEAENRIGGRINSIEYADSIVDLGAQWCHGETGNVVYERMKDLNVLQKTGDIADVVRFVRSDKANLSEETVNKLMKIALGSLPGENVPAFNGSLGDYVTKKYWEEVDKLENVDRALASELLQNFLNFECSVEGSDHLFEVSGRGHLEFVESGGDNSVHWCNKGYKTFLRVLMNSKPDDPNDLGVLNGHVELNKRIVEINWQGTNEVHLRTWNGELVTADHVICTVSLGVLKEQHEKLFIPALPEAKLRAINALKLGTVDKFLLEYTNEQPMPKDWPSVNFLWREQDLQELRGTKRFWLESVGYFHIVLCQPRLLEGWIIGEHARYMETLPEEEVLEGLQWLFRKFLPFDMPQPKSFLRTQWHSNPNFRGSYSYRTTYADALRTGPWDLESPLGDVSGKPRLQFAGEASSKTHYSTVHGATETGWREADRLNAYYSRDSPSK